MTKWEMEAAMYEVGQLRADPGRDVWGSRGRCTGTRGPAEGSGPDSGSGPWALLFENSTGVAKLAVPDGANTGKKRDR